VVTKFEEYKTIKEKFEAFYHIHVDTFT